MQLDQSAQVAPDVALGECPGPLAVLLGDGRRDRLQLGDGLHLSAAAHTRVAEMISKEITAHGAG